MPQKKPLSRKRRHELSIERAKTKLTQAPASNFVYLSEDALFEIFSYCDVESIIRSKRVCKVWHGIVNTRFSSMIRLHVGVFMSRDWPDELIHAWRRANSDESEEQNANTADTTVPAIPNHDCPPVPSTTSAPPPPPSRYKWIAIENVLKPGQWSMLFEFIGSNLEWIHIMSATPVVGSGEAISSSMLELRNCKYLQVLRAGSVLNHLRTTDPQLDPESEMALEELEISEVSRDNSFPVVTFFQRLYPPRLKRLILRRYEFIPAYFFERTINLEFLNLSGSSVTAKVRMPRTLRHLDISSPRGYRSCDFSAFSQIEGLTHLNMEGNTSLRQMSDLVKKLSQCKQLQWLNFRGCFGVEQVFLLRDIFFQLRSLERCICNMGEFHRRIRRAGYASRTLEEWHKIEFGESAKVSFVVSHIGNNNSTLKFKECKD